MAWIRWAISSNKIVRLIRCLCWQRNTQMTVTKRTTWKARRRLKSRALQLSNHGQNTVRRCWLNLPPPRNWQSCRASCPAVNWLKPKRRCRRKWNAAWISSMILKMVRCWKWWIYHSRSIKFVSNNWIRNWCRRGILINGCERLKLQFNAQKCWRTRRWCISIPVNSFSSPIF